MFKKNNSIKSINNYSKNNIKKIKKKNKFSAKFKNKKKTQKKIVNDKKNKFSSYYVLPDNSDMKIIEKKYCSCLMKVRSKKNPNPYGICTDAVYKSRGLVRDKVVECTEEYDFNKYNLKMLKMFAKEKKIKGYSKMNKPELLKKLNKYQEIKRKTLLNKK